jgi:NADPH:quinone reductase
VRAVVLRSYGGPEVLGLEEIPDPRPGPEEVVVQVVATALNRADLLQRQGRYPGPPMAHEVPGLEHAGRVLAVGERVTRWAPGDAVMGIVGGGSYAEQLAVHERQVVAVPAGVALADAAAIPEVFLTAWDALVVQGGLTSGRWALVHAGASGVGTAAIQLAKAVGGFVAVTCSAGKVEACRALGADLVVDYGSQDFVSEVHAATGGRGADVILDVIGGEYVGRNLDAVAVQGRIVQVGVMGAPTATVDVFKLLPNRVHWIGTVLRSRPLEEKIVVTQRFEREVLPLFANGALRPVIDRRYPLAEVAAAQTYLATNASVGKVLLDVSPG